MKKYNYILIILLSLSLIFNFFTWKEIDQIKANQNQIASDGDINLLRSELSSIRLNLKKSMDDKKWLKNMSFTVDKEKSNDQNISVIGEWTFSELGKGESLYILLREVDTANWEKIKLADNGGLSFNTNLLLSPEKHYQYQLVSEGTNSRGSDILTIPYQIYGLPKWNTELRLVKKNNSKQPSIELNIHFHSSPPLPNLAPINANIVILKDNMVEKTIPFEVINNNKIWRAYIGLNPKDIKDYKFQVIVEYKNGTKQTQSVSHINRVVYDSADEHTVEIKQEETRIIPNN